MKNQRTFNVAFVVTIVALAALFGFGVDAKLDKLEAKDKAITSMVAEANDASVNGDMVLSNVDNNQQEQLYKLRDNLIALSNNTDATVAQLKKAIVVAAEAAAEGDAEIADQFNAIIANLGMALEAKFANLEAELDANAEAAAADVDAVQAQLDAQVAKHNAFVADATVAINMANAKDIKKTQKDLDRTMSRNGIARNENAIARAQKNLDDKITRATKAVTRAEKFLQKSIDKPITNDGWVFKPRTKKNHDKDVARKTASVMKKQAELTDLLNGLSSYNKRMENDKADIAKREAKIQALKDRVAKLTL